VWQGIGCRHHPLCFCQVVNVRRRVKLPCGRFDDGRSGDSIGE